MTPAVQCLKKRAATTQWLGSAVELKGKGKGKTIPLQA